MWTDEQTVRNRLAALQEDIGQSGFYSALWKEGDTWHFIAGTDAHWVDERMHAEASPDATVTWIPAYPGKL